MTTQKYLRSVCKALMAVAVAALFDGASALNAADPTVARVTPAGITAGKPRIITLLGDRLADATGVLFYRDGLTVTTADGGMKAHPAVAIERDARLAFARLVRELDLDAGAPSGGSRPPALGSNRRI